MQLQYLPLHAAQHLEKLKACLETLASHRHGRNAAPGMTMQLLLEMSRYFSNEPLKKVLARIDF